jgi:DNA-binding transcriptional ArsR family regulator
MPKLDAACSALADPTRRAILARLALGEAKVMEIAEPFDMVVATGSLRLRRKWVMKRNARSLAATAGQPPAPEHAFTMRPPSFGIATGSTANAYHINGNGQRAGRCKRLATTPREEPCRGARPSSEAKAMIANAGGR